MSKLATLLRWSKVMGPASLFQATKLLGTGRTGGDANIGAARPLRARNNPLTIHARPGSDDLLVFLEIFLEGEYERVHEYIHEPIQTVLDLGTNIGCSIAYFANIFPQANFVGVEPSKQNVAMAQRTLAPLIDAGRVKLVNAFIGARQRSAVLARGGSGGSNELFLSDAPTDPSTETIEVVTVPQLIESQGLKQIDLLKCDIEGGERELFSDCAAWIGKVRWIVIELHEKLDTNWLTDRLRAGGADFGVLHAAQKKPGISVVWLKRRGTDL